MRTLLAAYRRRLQLDWRPTAFLLAMLHNVNCSDKSKMKKPSVFDIYRDKPTTNRMTAVQQIRAMASMFQLPPKVTKATEAEMVAQNCATSAETEDEQ
jgi:hypothetical protein